MLGVRLQRQNQPVVVSRGDIVELILIYAIPTVCTPGRPSSYHSARRRGSRLEIEVLQCLGDGQARLQVCHGLASTGAVA